MKRQEALDRLRGLPQITELEVRSPERVYMEVEPEDLDTVCEFAFCSLGGRFCTATAVDGRQEIEILYHFILEETNQMLSFRVRLDRKSPSVASMTPLFPAADFIEREIHELFGVDFLGHPSPARLLLPEQWPEGVYPLRRDYVEWDPEVVRDRGAE
jgi:NADH-quinone oxidoreductase subunit C